MTREERIAKIRGGRWIRYPLADRIAAKLEELLLLPKTYRMPNLLIVRPDHDRFDLFVVNSDPAKVTTLIDTFRGQVGIKSIRSTIRGPKLSKRS